MPLMRKYTSSEKLYEIHNVFIENISKNMASLKKKGGYVSISKIYGLHLFVTYLDYKKTTKNHYRC